MWTISGRQRLGPVGLLALAPFAAIFLHLRAIREHSAAHNVRIIPKMMGAVGELHVGRNSSREALRGAYAKEGETGPSQSPGAAQVPVPSRRND
jgi:hypothetical protein